VAAKKPTNPGHRGFLLKPTISTPKPRVLGAPVLPDSLWQALSSYIMDVKHRRAFLGGTTVRKKAHLVTNNSVFALDTLLMINILKALLVPGMKTVQPQSNHRCFLYYPTSAFCAPLSPSEAVLSDCCCSGVGRRSPTSNNGIARFYV